MRGMRVRRRGRRRLGEMFLLESQEWARCTVVADKVAFALAVSRPLVLNDRNTALDLEYYCRQSTVRAQWG